MLGVAAEYFREDKPEPGEDMTQEKDLQLANWRFSEVVAAVVEAVEAHMH